MHNWSLNEKAINQLITLNTQSIVMVSRFTVLTSTYAVFVHTYAQVYVMNKPFISCRCPFLFPTGEEAVASTSLSVPLAAPVSMLKQVSNPSWDIQMSHIQATVL